MIMKKNAIKSTGNLLSLSKVYSKINIAQWSRNIIK